MDMQDWIRAGLEDLGHRVTMSATRVDPSAINIFWEDFDPDFADQLRSLDVAYGIFATEVADGGGFNNRREPEWVERYRVFPEVAKRAQFIWTTVESSVDFYKEFAPTSFVEFGFSPKLVRISTEVPYFDFSFFGLRTPHRESIIGRLRKAGCKVVWPSFLLEQKDLFQLIDQSKVGLSFRQSGAWPIPSPTRLGRYMHAKRVIACEWTPQHTRQSQILRHPQESDEIVEFVFSLLRSDLRAEALRVFEDYRERLPMKRVMETVLDKTLPKTGPMKLERTNGLGLRELMGKPTPYFVDVVGGHNIIQTGNDYFSLPRDFGTTDLGKLKNLPPTRRWKIAKEKDLGALKKKIYKRGRFCPYAPTMIYEKDDVEVWDLDTYFVGVGRRARQMTKEPSIEIWQRIAKRTGDFFHYTRDRSLLELKIAQHQAKES